MVPTEILIHCRTGYPAKLFLQTLKKPQIAGEEREKTVHRGDADAFDLQPHETGQPRLYLCVCCALLCIFLQNVNGLQRTPDKHTLNIPLF